MMRDDAEMAAEVCALREEARNTHARLQELQVSPCSMAGAFCASNLARSAGCVSSALAAHCA